MTYHFLIILFDIPDYEVHAFTLIAREWQVSVPRTSV